MKPAIIGVAGQRLTADEAILLRRHKPLGAIIFARNLADPAQLRALTAEIRECLGRDAPILVDQEGGRVARLKPPHWRAHPPGASFENGPASAAQATAAAIGAECRAVGLDVVCAPVLDLRLPGMHKVIGDRAFSAEPAEVTRLAGAWIAGLRQAGVQPVIKHIPGHGRATLDSHEALPVVTANRAELAADFLPFQALGAADLWGMTAHILYTALDDALCATLSPRVIAEVIRGEIGFDGFLLSDDLGMKALDGTLPALTRAALGAGCDAVLHCSGVFSESLGVLEACPALSERAEARLEASRGHCRAA